MGSFIACLNGKYRKQNNADGKIAKRVLIFMIIFDIIFCLLLKTGLQEILQGRKITLKFQEILPKKYPN